MARSTGRPAKEPGRVKQLIDVFHMTRKADPTLIWWMLLAFLVPLLIGIVLSVFAGRSSARSCGWCSASSPGSSPPSS